MDMGHIKNFTSDGAIEKRRFVKFSATDGRVVQAAGAAGEALIGVTNVVGTVGAGERVDVALDGPQTLEAGAAFVAGSALIADAQGRAVAAAPGAGVTIVGGARALEASAGAGQHVAVLVGPTPVVG